MNRGRTILPAAIENVYAATGYLDPFEDRGDALAAADAHRNQRIPAAGPAQLVEGLGDQDGTGGAERVPEGDAASVRVGPFRRKAELCGDGEYRVDGQPDPVPDRMLRPGELEEGLLGQRLGQVPPLTSATRPWTMPGRVDRGYSCPSAGGVAVVIACFLSPACQ